MKPFDLLWLLRLVKSLLDEIRAGKGDYQLSVVPVLIKIKIRLAIFRYDNTVNDMVDIKRMIEHDCFL